MQVTSLLPTTDDTNQSYLFEEFIESHIPYLIQNFVTSTREITPNIAAIYKGDFYGLLSYISMPIDLHYILLRVNGFYSSGEFKGETFMLKLVSTSECTLLRNVYKTVPK